MAASRRALGLLLAAVLAAAGCRTVPALDPGRLAALEPHLGRLLLVGFQGTALEGNAEVERLLCEVRVGGVVLFGRNVESRAQLQRLTADLQARARACAGAPLLIAVDAEGGQVMRLAPVAGWTETLPAAELGASNDLAFTELEARRVARMLREVGINWNLAPVVDVGYNPANPVIVGAARAFGASPLVVAAHARAFVRGMHAEGILTALKHFPGHGSSWADSHAGFVDVTDTARTETELVPYRLLLAEGLVDSVMTAHVVNRARDADYPATLSSATITGLLRAELGWQGPVLTDDLRMSAIEQTWGLARAAPLALGAGVDMLLIADDRLPDGGSAAALAVGAVRAALAGGRLAPARVEAALARVRALTARLR